MNRDQDQLAISVKNLNKEYVSYKKPYDILWESISGKTQHTVFKALENINFDIKKGEVVGIIGANGAGKSTLLKILAGTLNKTSGEIKVNGRISAILELGTGFHPDYTGRENIFLGGMCLGMTRKEVESKLSWIIEFSELEKFIDQPFKTYSSGMQARLTFTAISVDPEIFIVDEALAAGDAGFVEKCLGRMDEIVKAGSTVLIVTHNTNLIPRFGSRAIWIEEGLIKADGDAKEIAKRYEISTYESVQRRMGRQEKIDEAIGDQKITIRNVKLSGESVSDGIYLQGKPFAIELEIESLIKTSTSNVIIFINRSDGQLVWSGSSQNFLTSKFEVGKQIFELDKGLYKIKLQLDFLQLNAGSYYINAGVEPQFDVARTSDYHDWKIRVSEFSVVRRDHLIVGKVFDSPSYWSIASDLPQVDSWLQPSISLQSIDEISTCELLKYPYPYKSAISISNDCEFATRKTYEGLHKLLCTSLGLGLEVTSSAFFYTTNSMCHSSIGYFDGTSNRKSYDAGYLSEMIKSNWIDTIHAYGDFDNGGFRRDMAENVLNEFLKESMVVPIFSNHGSDKNIQNIGYAGLNGYQEGDLPTSSAYHLDLTTQLGVRYFWADTEITKTPISIDSPLRKVFARDGSQIKLFKRYRGLVGKAAPNAGSLSEQILLSDIDEIIKSHSACIYYQHLGVRKKTSSGTFEENDFPYFDGNAMKVLEYLATKYYDGDCLVAGVGRLLKYFDVRDSLYYEIVDGNIFIKTSQEDFTSNDLMGISFKISSDTAIRSMYFQIKNGLTTQVTFSKKSLNGFDIYYFPWKRLA